MHNEGFYARAMAEGSLGLGESYLDGWWDCRRLDEFFCRILRIELDSKAFSWGDLAAVLRAKVFNLQRLSRAFQIGRHHYDIGNDLFRLMLGKRMIYTSGYWERASDLDQAQEAKLELAARKLQLRPGMRILDIGCGWGGWPDFSPNVTKSRSSASPSMPPSAKWISRAVEGLFMIEDWQNFGADYGRTLMAWYDNFQTSWNQVCEKYGERFRRMWEYYLCCCAAPFALDKFRCGRFSSPPTGLPAVIEHLYRSR